MKSSLSDNKTVNKIAIVKHNIKFGYAPQRTCHEKWSNSYVPIWKVVQCHSNFKRKWYMHVCQVHLCIGCA